VLSKSTHLTDGATVKVKAVEGKKVPNFRKLWTKSYSQCGEDLIVNYVFGALNIKKPSYIDVGAYHPQHLSNTALLYERGSRGVNIEPDPKLFRYFLRRRKGLEFRLQAGSEM